MRALLPAVLTLLLAGCVAPAVEVAPTPELETPGLAGWGESVRVVTLGEGASFGLLQLDLSADASVTGERNGLAARATGLGDEGWIELFGLTPSPEGWTFGGSWAARGEDGAFAIGQDSGPAIFLFVADAPVGVTLELTAWTAEEAPDFDAQFERPAVAAVWDATGPALVSVATASAAGKGSRGMTATGESAGAGPLVAAGFQLATDHEGVEGLEVARATFAGLASASAFQVNWANGDAQETRTIPAASAPGPVRPHPGFTLLQESDGPTSLQVEMAGAAALGGFSLRHYSLAIDLEALGIEVREQFESGIEP